MTCKPPKIYFSKIFLIFFLDLIWHLKRGEPADFEDTSFINHPIPLTPTIFFSDCKTSSFRPKCWFRCNRNFYVSLTCKNDLLLNFWWSSIRQLLDRNLQKKFDRNVVFLVHIFLLSNLRSSQTCSNSEDYWVGTKLVDFTGKDIKILTKSGKFLLFFTKTHFSQKHAGTLDFFFKNEVRNLKFGVVVPQNCV